MFPNTAIALWPGQFVNVRLTVDTIKNAIVAPTAAVQRGPSGAYVYVVQDDGSVAQTNVTVGQQNERLAVILSGLAPPARVATSGFARLTNGAKTRVIDAPPQTAEASDNAPPRRACRRRGACGGRAAGSGARSAAAARPAKGRRRRRRNDEPNGRDRMNVSAPFIARPIATSLLGVAVLLAGLLGYSRLPVSPLPQVDFPTIQVTTQLPGANPDTIASLVTASLERQFGQIPALSTMSSQSSFGLSQITLQFDLDRDIDAAAQDVQSAINAAASTLPRNLPYPPVYSKVNPADTPIMTLALRVEIRVAATDERSRRYADRAASERSQRRRPRVGRGRHQAGDPHPGRSRAARREPLGLEDVRLAIVGANVAGAKGSLDGARQAYTIDANDQIGNADAYKSIVVAYRNSAPIILSDVANVVEGLENSRVGGWYQGEPAVIVDVQRQPGANIISTVDLIQKELPRLQRSMPAGVQLQLVHDRTDAIRASIADVQFTLVLATALVVLVVLLFLRTLRATLIAAVALPLSIIAHFRRDVSAADSVSTICR